MSAMILQHRLLDLGERVVVGFFKSLALALHAAVEIVDLLLKFAPLFVQGFRRQRCLLPLQGVAFGAQHLLFVRDLLGVFDALLLDLTAHHLGRFRVLQQRLNVDHQHAQILRHRERGGRRRDRCGCAWRGFCGSRFARGRGGGLGDGAGSKTAQRQQQRGQSHETTSTLEFCPEADAEELGLVERFLA